MKWLLGTFANRYHRFRKVIGKLFQGRFKSLIVETKELLKSAGLLKDGDFKALRMEGRDLAEANELLWEELLERGFRGADLA